MATKKKYQKKPQEDLYQMVTDKVVSLLEMQLETDQPRRPWIMLGADGGPARNPATSNIYRGINQFLLSLEMMLGPEGFHLNRWLTFKQAKEKGGNVIKGSKSTPVLFFKPIRLDRDGKYYSEEAFNSMSQGQRQAIGLHKIPMAKKYAVFNVSQCDNLPEEFYEAPPQEPLTDMQQDDRAEDLLMRATERMGVDLQIKESNRAFYDRSADRIVLPLREQFRGAAERFYSTAMHELGHSTGHRSRLARTFGKAHGDIDYAREEVVVELNAAMLCSIMNIEMPITENVEYIRGWLSLLKQDKKAIVSCASAAQKASDLILEGTPYQIRPEMP